MTEWKVGPENITYRGEQSGESTRHPPLWPVLRPGVTCGLSLLLVLVPAPMVFLWFLQFSSLLKNQLTLQFPILSACLIITSC